MKKQNIYRLAAILLFAAMAIAVPQFAQAATTAGTAITNNVTVNFNVLGVAQPPVTASYSFVVGRKIDLLVQKKSDVTTGPSSTTPALVYLVTNNSNTTIRFGLSTQASTTANSAAMTSPLIWLDANNNGAYDAGDTQYSGATLFGDVASGASITVLVTATTPGGATDGQLEGYFLVAQAYEPVSAGTISAIGATAGAFSNTVVQTVFADAAGSVDGQYDGKHSAMALFTVNASTVTVNKSSIVYADGLGNSAPNAKAIPGATIEYTVVVKNNGGTATAQSITLTDTLDNAAKILPVTGSWSSTNGGSVSCTNQAVAKINGGAWACIGSWSSQTLSATIGSLASGQTATVLYQATVQ